MPVLPEHFHVSGFMNEIAYHVTLQIPVWHQPAVWHTPGGDHNYRCNGLTNVIDRRSANTGRDDVNRWEQSVVLPVLLVQYINQSTAANTTSTTPIYHQHEAVHGLLTQLHATVHTSGPFVVYASLRYPPLRSLTCNNGIIFFSGTLLAYTLVSISVLILRYQPCLHDLPIPMAHQTQPLDTIEESPDGDSDDVFSEQTRAGKRKLKDDQQLLSPSSEKPAFYGSLPFKSETVENWIAYCRRHGKILWLTLGFPSEEALPNAATAQNVIIFTGSLCLSEACACMVIVFGHKHLVEGSAWAVLLLLVFLGAMAASLVFILRQPQNK